MATQAGMWRGRLRPAGLTIGRGAGWLRSAWFMFLATAIFLAISIGLWKSLPFSLNPPARLALLAAGCLLFFPGISLLLWARLTLGKMYFVSTGFGAQLFADHRLITHGPFAIVRHPMYLGLFMSALGSLLLYQTWATVVYVLIAPFVLMRTRREEKALAAQFGQEWQAYCRRVPAFFPGLRREK